MKQIRFVIIPFMSRLPGGPGAGACEDIMARSLLVRGDNRKLLCNSIG